MQSRAHIEKIVATAKQRLGTNVDGKYRLRAILGIGGMGVVYEAQHLFLDRTVALKVLHPRYEDAHDAAERFLREARTAGTLGHRAIVSVLDAGFLDGTTPYLVMQHLIGENVKQRIVRRGGLRVAQAVVVLREMMKGLGAAHAKGIVHCDLKPENVFIVDRRILPGNIRILDFGIARFAREQREPPSASSQLRVYGTPEYMAPEQILGEEPIPATDLYAAGALVYEALAARPPFLGAPIPSATVFQNVLRDAPPELVGVREPLPEALVALVMRMLEKRPDARPREAKEVLDALDDAGLFCEPELEQLARLESGSHRHDRSR
jgi:serine/threonine-protein kinase